MSAFRLLKRLSTATACGSLLGFSAIGAADTRYEMISYLDSVSGRRLEARDYDGAIEIALQHARARGAEARLIEHTNLCVAYTLTGRYAAANEACESALNAAKRVDENHSRVLPRLGTETAKAITNRGVLRAMSGDMAGAESDFKAATAMHGASSAPSRNLEHLEIALDARLAMIEGRRGSGR